MNLYYYIITIFRMYQSFVGAPLPNTSSLYSPRSAILPNTVTSSLAPPIQPSYNARSLGLVNLGNTCFMSSVLQVLFDIFNFRDAHLSNKPVTQAYMKLRETHNDLDYEDFKSAAGKIMEMVSDYDQEDAHEFLSGFLEALNRENQEMKCVSKSTFKMDFEKSVFENWESFCYEMSQSDNSVVIRLLGGELFTELKCPENHPKYLFERVLNLSLSFPEPNKGNHLQDFLLNHF